MKFGDPWLHTGYTGLVQTNKNNFFIYRLVQLEKVENPLLIIYVGFAGLFINLIGLVLFHGHSHGHHHDHHHHEQHPDQGHTEILVEHKGFFCSTKITTN